MTAAVRVLRRYVAAMALGSLTWEFAHMPLYALWETGTPAGIVFAALHCSGGDILIALGALAGALLLFGDRRWPDRGYRRVAVATLAIGLGYTLFSEWWNVEIRGAWVYRDLMPVIPVIGAGLSPVAQWVVLPVLALGWAIRGLGSSGRSVLP